MSYIDYHFPAKRLSSQELIAEFNDKWPGGFIEAGPTYLGDGVWVEQVTHIAFTAPEDFDESVMGLSAQMDSWISEMKVKYPSVQW